MKKLLCLMLLFISNICLATISVNGEQASKNIISTPVITAAVPYAVGQQIGGIGTLTAFLDDSDYAATLITTNITDADTQNAQITIYFFSQLPVVTSTDHTTLNIPDSSMLFCTGSVTITNYASTGQNSIGQVNGLFLNLFSTDLNSGQKKTGTIYYVAKVNATTPTYTSTSALQFRFGVYL